MSEFDKMAASQVSATHEFEYVTVLVDRQIFGLPIERVHDVFIASALTRVPLAPREIAGLLNLRGRIVTALCLRRRLGLPDKDVNGEDMAVGLEHHGEAFGLLVDSVGEVMRLTTDTLEKNPVKRDPELYYFSVFGKPAAKGSWGWRVEGHHMSLNFTVVNGGLIATAPVFLGANPGEVRQGPLKGRRVLRAEEDLGRELALSLDEKQRAVAVIAKEAPAEVLTTNQPKLIFGMTR